MLLVGKHAPVLDCLALVLVGGTAEELLADDEFGQLVVRPFLLQTGFSRT